MNLGIKRVIFGLVEKIRVSLQWGEVGGKYTWLMFSPGIKGYEVIETLDHDNYKSPKNAKGRTWGKF